MAATRRALLGSGVAAGAAALLVGCDDSSSPAPSSAAFDPLDWDSVRAQFLLDAELAQFAAFVLSPHTALLQAAIDGYRDELATDTEAALLAGLEREAAVRKAAASYAGGSPAQYALTDSTTMGVATMYGGLGLGPGDEVLTTTHDFYSTEASLDLLARRTGAAVRRVTLYDDPATATVDEMVARLLGGIGPRTKVVAVTWVHSSTTEQATQLKEALAEVDGVRVVTPAAPEVSAGIVCVDVSDLPPGNAVLELRNRGIVASATPYARSYLRLGPSIATTPEQVDAAAAAVAELV